MDIKILCIVIGTQGGKMGADIVEGRNGNNPLFPPYHVIVELGMSPGKKYIEVFPFRRGFGEAQPCVAVGDDNMLRMDILDLFVFGILGNAF